MKFLILCSYFTLFSAISDRVIYCFIVQAPTASIMELKKQVIVLLVISADAKQIKFISGSVYYGVVMTRVWTQTQVYS